MCTPPLVSSAHSRAASLILQAALLSTCLLASIPSIGQSVNYVTDRLRLEARSGPSTAHKIVEMLPSGTRLEVLERSAGYSRVRMPTGSEAWILSRFLQDEPPAREQIESALRERDLQRRQLAELSDALTDSEGKGREALAAGEKLRYDNQELRRQLAETKQAAASPLAMRRENTRLSAETAQLKKRFQLLDRERRKLEESNEQEWFIAGGGVLLAGLLLGLVLPKLASRRRRGWSDF